MGCRPNRDGARHAPRASAAKEHRRRLPSIYQVMVSGTNGVLCNSCVRRLYIHGGQERFEQREAVVLLVLRQKPA
ncbi:ATP-dependent Clp protease, ATP-binding subunit ClpX [Burkholderia pseudomallei MSHR5609]|nr:ATP-dependent Clp protease, ATP-binding subunit ClpX [Burkholderia pseudomallei MSHR5609]